MDLILIPTYKRIEKQLTWDLIPEKWRDKTFLIVSDSEYDEHLKRGRNAVVCPVQGSGLAPVREWIAKKYYGNKISIVDDDLEKLEVGYGNKYRNFDSEDDFDEMMKVMDNYLEKFPCAHIGACMGTTISSDPKYLLFNHSVPIVWMFYNLTFISYEDINRINWTLVPVWQDVAVGLQFLMLGYSTIGVYKYRYTMTPFNEGGVSEFRDNKIISDCIKKIADTFPEVCRINENPIPNHSNSLCNFLIINWERLFGYLLK